VIALATCAQGDAVLVEAGTHHIGDETLTLGLFANWPHQEATRWDSIPFDWPYAASGTLQVVLDTVDSEQSTVYVNGTLIGEIPIDQMDASIWHNDLGVPFDGSLLEPTGNAVSIVCRYWPEASNYDDLLFRNVWITPEPATLSLLAVGGLMALRRRR